MTTAYRPPIGTTATINDFRTSDWNGDISSDRSYQSWWNFLWHRGFEATQAGQFAKARVLWLLGDACSLRLQPSNRTEPLVATQVNEFQRPSNLDSFEDADIELLARIYPEVENVVLKARLADIVWLRTTPKRDRNAAIAAIDAYRSTPTSDTAWYLESRDCWRWAIALAEQLKAGAGQRVQEMSAALQLAAEKSLRNEDQNHVAVSISQTLLECDLAQASYEQLAEMFLARGARLTDDKKFFVARNHLNTAKQLFDSSKNQERQDKTSMRIAAAWEGEAIERTPGSQPSYMVAVEFYMQAIQELTSIAKARRPALGVDLELRRLYGLLREAGARSLDEFPMLHVDAPDLSTLIEEAEASASNKELMKAFFALAHCATYTPKNLLISNDSQPAG